MADITKIRLDNNDYDIKDAEARENRIKIIRLSTTDNVQTALSDTQEKIIIFPAGQTITVTDALILNSDTTIDLNGGTIVFDFQRSSIFTYDWDETLGFMSYAPDSTYTGYNGVKNIVIKNGSIAGGSSCFLHSKNVTFDGITFTNSFGSRHCLQFGGCYDVTVKNCIFNGVKTIADASQSSECINIDPCTYGAQPFIDELSSMFDHTRNRNITIENNIFNTTNNTNHGYYTAVGSHGGDNAYIIAENVVIRGNDFTDPIYSGINIRDYENVTIANNVLNGDTSSTGQFIVKRGVITNLEISNNVAIGVVKFLGSESPTNAMTNVTCTGNNIDADDPNTDTYGVFSLLNAHNVLIANNKLKFQHHVAFLHSKDYWDGTSEGSSVYCTDIEFSNNTFEKTVNSAQNWNIRLNSTTGVKFVNNNFVHDGTLATSYYDFLVQNNISGLEVVSNTTDAPFKFMNVTQCNNKNHNNTAYYLNIQDGLSSQNTSGTFLKDVTVFRTIRLTLGGGTNTQVVDLKPYMYPTDYITARTYKFPVAKDDGTYGVATFTITDATNWSYVGNISIRLIHVMD